MKMRYSIIGLGVAALLSADCALRQGRTEPPYRRLKNMPEWVTSSTPIYSFDTDRNGIPELYHFDRNRNGAAELDELYVDTNQDGTLTPYVDVLASDLSNLAKLTKEVAAEVKETADKIEKINEGFNEGVRQTEDELKRIIDLLNGTLNQVK